MDGLGVVSDIYAKVAGVQSEVDRRSVGRMASYEADYFKQVNIGRAALKRRLLDIRKQQKRIIHQAKIRIENVTKSRKTNSIRKSPDIFSLNVVFDAKKQSPVLQKPASLHATIDSSYLQNLGAETVIIQSDDKITPIITESPSYNHGSSEASPIDKELSSDESAVPDHFVDDLNRVRKTKSSAYLISPERGANKSSTTPYSTEGIGHLDSIPSVDFNNNSISPAREAETLPILNNHDRLNNVHSKNGNTSYNIENSPTFNKGSFSRKNSNSIPRHKEGQKAKGDIEIKPANRSVVKDNHVGLHPNEMIETSLGESNEVSKRSSSLSMHDGKLSRRRSSNIINGTVNTCPARKNGQRKRLPKKPVSFIDIVRMQQKYRSGTSIFNKIEHQFKQRIAEVEHDLDQRLRAINNTDEGDGNVVETVQVINKTESGDNTNSQIERRSSVRKGSMTSSTMTRRPSTDLSSRNSSVMSGERKPSLTLKDGELQGLPELDIELTRARSKLTKKHNKEAFSWQKSLQKVRLVRAFETQLTSIYEDN